MFGIKQMMMMILVDLNAKRNHSQPAHPKLSCIMTHTAGTAWQADTTQNMQNTSYFLNEALLVWDADNGWCEKISHHEKLKMYKT